MQSIVLLTGHLHATVDSCPLQSNPFKTVKSTCQNGSQTLVNTVLPNHDQDADGVASSISALDLHTFRGYSAFNTFLRWSWSIKFTEATEGKMTQKSMAGLIKSSNTNAQIPNHCPEVCIWNVMWKFDASLASNISFITYINNRTIFLQAYRAIKSPLRFYKLKISGGNKMTSSQHREMQNAFQK